MVFSPNLFGLQKFYQTAIRKNPVRQQQRLSGHTLARPLSTRFRRLSAASSSPPICRLKALHSSLCAALICHPQKALARGRGRNSGEGAETLSCATVRQRFGARSDDFQPSKWSICPPKVIIFHPQTDDAEMKNAVGNLKTTLGAEKNS